MGSVENYPGNERKLILEMHHFFTKNHDYGRKGIFSKEYLLMLFVVFCCRFLFFVDVLFCFASDGAKMFWGRGLYIYFLFWLAFGNV